MSNWKELTGGRRFISDLGQEHKVTTEDGETVVMGRYAVWAPIPRSDRHAVVEVGSDVEELAKKYNVPEELIMRVVKPGANGHAGA